MIDYDDTTGDEPRPDPLTEGQLFARIAELEGEIANIEFGRTDEMARLRAENERLLKGARKAALAYSDANCRSMLNDLLSTTGEASP